MPATAEVNNKRTKRVFIGSVSIVLSRTFSLACGLLLTGILARYFTPEEFGLWAILTFAIGIIPVLDIGIGLALRNKLAGLYSGKNNHSQECETSFFAVFYTYACIAAILVVLIWLAKDSIPWESLFNTDNSDIISKGSVSFILAFTILVISLPFTISTAGFFSYQETHWNSFIELLKSIFTILFVGLLVLDGASYTTLVVSFSTAILLSLIISFFVFLKKRHWKIILVRGKTIAYEIRKFISKSFQFGIMQVCSTIMFSIQALIVSNVIGLRDAGEYALVQKLFLILNILSFAVLTPLWSAYTESLSSKDIKWAKRALLYSAVYTVLLFTIGSTLLYIFGKTIILLWTGKTIITTRLYFFMGLWVFITGWVNCFSVFLNGIGKLNLQTILLTLAAIMYIPLALYLGKKFGITGICASGIIVLIPLAISNPIQSIMSLKDFDRIRGMNSTRSLV